MALIFLLQWTEVLGWNSVGATKKLSVANAYVFTTCFTEVKNFTNFTISVKTYSFLLSRSQPEYSLCAESVKKTFSVHLTTSTICTDSAHNTQGQFLPTFSACCQCWRKEMGTGLQRHSALPLCSTIPKPCGFIQATVTTT